MHNIYVLHIIDEMSIIQIVRLNNAKYNVLKYTT